MSGPDDTGPDGGATSATRRDALRGLAAVGAAATLAGCSAEAIPGNEPGTHLRYSTVLPPASLDPIEVVDPWSMGAANAVFQRLYTYDADLNPVPVLADGPPSVSDDGRRYRVRLVDGARFQDGTRVSAADVKYSFEAPVAEETRPLWLTNAIAEVRTPDRSTVEFRLAYPYPAFRHSLTRPVVPRSVREGNPERFGTAPDATVGSGPYEPHLIKPGKYAELRSWEGYWTGTTPPIDRLRLINTHAGLARTMALKTGQSDVVERVQPDFWDATKRIPSACVVRTPSYHSFFVGFNCSSGPTEDPRVRRAVDYLLSMDAFVEHVVGPAGTPQHSPLPDRLAAEWGLPLEEWTGLRTRKNVAEARALFAEAEVGSWTPTVAVPHNDKLREKLAEALVRGLTEAGFTKARVRKYHWRHFRERVTSGNEGDYNLYVGSWAGFPDPDAFLYPLFHQRMEGITNGVYYRNPDVMDAIERARRTRDRPTRRRLYERAITTLLEERVHLPAFTLHNSFGVKERVEGFEPHPLAQFNPQLVAGERAVSIRDG